MHNLLQHHLIKLPDNENSKRRILGYSGEKLIDFFAEPDITCSRCKSRFEVIRGAWTKYKHPKYQKSWDSVSSEFFLIRTIHPGLIRVIIQSLEYENYCPACEGKDLLMPHPNGEFDLELLCLSFETKDEPIITRAKCQTCDDIYDINELNSSPYGDDALMCDDCHEQLTIMG